jgi:hypothetical protein
VAAGFDASLPVSRIAEETGDDGPASFVSPIWEARLNPGGLGAVAVPMGGH